MGNRYIVANYGFVPLVGAVNHRSVLNIGPVADCNAVNITPDNGVEPNSTVAPHNYLANNGCVIGIPAVITELGMLSPNRFN